MDVNKKELKEPGYVMKQIKKISDPELIEKAIEENKQRYKNKIRRKGYK